MDPNVVRSGTFDQIWKTKGLGNYNGFTEQFYAQPLVYTPPGSVQSVYVISQQNYAYRLDALTGAILASRQLAIPFLTIPDLDGCNDIADCVGSTATGVIDPARNAWYLTTKTYIDQSKTTAQGLAAGRYLIHALDVLTLEEKTNYPVGLEGMAADNAPWRIFEGGKHHQRPALMQIGEWIYAGFASHCVQWNFTGWVVGWEAGSGKVVAAYAMEGGREASGKGGGVWMSGGGLASDNAGRMFFATGNGYASQLADDPVPGRQPPTALEEAVVNMAINSDGSLTPSDFFMPWEKRDLDGMDKDLGTSGFILLEPSVFSAGDVSRIGCVAGKTGKLYFLNLDTLGGYQMGPGRKDAALQTIQLPGPVFASAGTYPFEGGYVYVTPVGHQTIAYKFGVSSTGAPIFTEAGKTAHQAAGRQGVGHTMVTTLNGEPGTGILWIVDVDGTNLRAYGTVPVNGILPTYAMLNNPGQMKFSRPTFGDGKVYVTTHTGYITAFGSPVNMPLNCSSPYDLGRANLGNTTTAAVSCTALTATRIDSIDLDVATHFGAGNYTLPRTLAAGDKFTLTANFTPRAVGPLSTNLNLRTTNLGGQKFATNTPVVLRGVGVSVAAVLSVSPSVLSFGEVVTGADSAGTELTFAISNGGLAPLVIQSYQWSNVSAKGPFTPLESLGSPFTFKGLPPVNGTVAPEGQALVTATFLPTRDGYSTLYLSLTTSGGTGTVGFFGTAGRSAAAVLEWQLSNGTWTPYSPAAPFEFDGGVLLGTQQTRKMRLTNRGGTTLTTTISKPPVSGALAASNALGSIAEGSQLAPNASEVATLVCSPPKGQVNLDPVAINATWTMNNNDPTFGKHTIEFLCAGRAPQVGPLDAAGQGYFRYAGCYKDADPERQLEKLLYYSQNNTNQQCFADCLAQGAGYALAATQYEGECWCGKGRGWPRTRVADVTCGYLCRGDYTQYCGGDGTYMSLFYDRRVVSPPGNDTTSSTTTSSSTTTAPTTSPTTSPTTTTTTTAPTTAPTNLPGNYTYLGCATEGVGGRALPLAFTSSSTMTPSLCQTFCTGLNHPLSGTEYASECYCGTSLTNGAALGSAACTMACSGAPLSICGGPSALSVYNWTSAPAVVPVVPATPAVLPGYADYVSLGCWTEGTNERALSGAATSSANMSVPVCVDYCKARGFALAGVEYAAECYCGQTLAATSMNVGASQCGMVCKGDAGSYCGGGNRLNVYRRNTTATAGAGVKRRWWW
ncbi:hypothetical protein EDC01DRAFT_623331 [Geopyxis carbonaria]|nr:hypothetical protein EDC01DRAFT_623331 [Geopyxis carbonaria]